MPSVGHGGDGFSSCVSAEPSCPSGTQVSSRVAQPGFGDANGSLGTLNGAFLSPRRGEMRVERIFGSKVSAGKGQTMVI